MRRMTTTLAILAFFGLADRGRADLIIEAPTIVATQGEAGSFDVVIYSTGGSYQVANDSIMLALSGPSGVTFTAVDISTTPPYIFMLSGTTLPGGAFSTDVFPNTSFTASDSEFASPGYDVVDSLTPIGIAHVSFLVDLSASTGVRGLTFLSGGTSVTDSDANPIDFTAYDGSLTVRSVPEPSTCALLSFGLVCTIVGRKGWTRRRDA